MRCCFLGGKSFSSTAASTLCTLKCCLTAVAGSVVITLDAHRFFLACMSIFPLVLWSVLVSNYSIFDICIVSQSSHPVMFPSRHVPIPHVPIPSYSYPLYPYLPIRDSILARALSLLFASSNTSPFPRDSFHRDLLYVRRRRSAPMPIVTGTLPGP
jgi:hypothetical protein